MSLYDYLIGDRNWKDFGNNRDIGRRFETDLSKSCTIMAMNLNARDQQRAITHGFDSISDGSTAIADFVRFREVAGPTAAASGAKKKA